MVNEAKLAEQEITSAAISETWERLTSAQAVIVNDILEDSLADRDEKIGALNAALTLLKYGGES